MIRIVRMTTWIFASEHRLNLVTLGNTSYPPIDIED